MIIISNMGTTSSTYRISFSEMQRHVSGGAESIIISTLPTNRQHCLIPRTVASGDEEKIINALISNNKRITVIVYGSNCNDTTVDIKHKQLIGLGLINTKIYTGGMFEWLLLQEVYGDVEFPTEGKELDLFLYQPAVSQLKPNG